MKGVVVLCMKQMIIEKFGKEKWESILEKAGLPPNIIILSSGNVDDSSVLNVVKSAMDEFKITIEQITDMFGDYWVNVYSQKIYNIFYKRSKNAKDFILKMNVVHEHMTNNMQNAHPPRFEYNWENDKTLIMTYKSSRGLIDFAVGLVKGVGKFYNEDLIVEKLDASHIKIVFSK